jgi:Leucine-rich repeat (LRR) protein
MANLRELRANDNQLTALPPSIREVVKLEKVCVLQSPQTTLK